MLATRVLDCIKKQNTNFASYLEKQSVDIKGVYIGEKCFLLSNLNKPTLLVVPSLPLAQEYKRNLKKLGKNTEILSDVIDSLAFQVSNPLGVSELFLCLKLLCEQKLDVLIVYSPMLMQRLPSKTVFNSSCLNLQVGNDYKIEEVTKHLVSCGYERVDDICEQETFRVKGDIIDIFLDYEQCVTRLEFFGDNLESVRKLDINNFTTLEKVQSVVIYPLNFTIFNNKENEYFCLANSKSCSANICDWFSNYNIVFDEPARCYAILEKEYEDNNVTLQRRIQEQLLPAFYYNLFIDKQNWYKANTNVLSFENLDVANPFCASAKSVYYSCPNTMKYKQDVTQFYKDVVRFDRLNYTIIICTQNSQAINILKTRLQDLNLKFNIINKSDKAYVANQINIVTAELETGFGFLDEKFVVFTTQSFSGYVSKEEKPKTSDKSRVFYLPKVGDYVVHEKYGIAKCEAISKLNFGVNEKDYFVLTFAGNGKLYLPSEQLNELSSYVGEVEPKLDTLGTDTFKKAKEKARASVKKLAYDLKKLYAIRDSKNGYNYVINEELLNELIDSFGFELTDDQKSALFDVKQDMSNGKIMDRLICGDVGYGKTEIAILASFITILNNKQVALLVPTSVLCQQHFITFTNRLKNFGVKVGLLSRFQTNAQNKKTIEQIKNGEINIVCGTKRMLSADVVFKDLGLLVLDEEQRFGVNDKEKIKNFKQDINVLTLSATPIPRTLNMSLMGVRDISLITTPPKNRQAVQTIVCEQNDVYISEACNREVDRDGQVLILYNKVEDIFSLANKISKLIPQATIGVAHGQMSRAELDIAFKNLYEHKTQILVATTLIENGIDLPLANTLIVLNAGNFGLAQLYQLRGRVGRSDRNAYAYFMYKDQESLSQGGYERLKALKSFTSLGSGFKVAMRDLELRGAGDILGANQSGHIAKIGYDMYCKLMQEALSEQDNLEQNEKQDVYIECVLPAFIPQTYIQNEEDRISLYNKISHISSESEVLNVVNYINTNYGACPKEVEELCEIGLLKNLAQSLKIKKLQIKGNVGDIEFYFAPEEENLKLLLDSGFKQVQSNTKFEYSQNVGAERIQNHIKKCIIHIKNNEKNKQ